MGGIRTDEGGARRKSPSQGHITQDTEGHTEEVGLSRMARGLQLFKRLEVTPCIMASGPCQGQEGRKRGSRGSRYCPELQDLGLGWGELYVPI